MVTLFYKISTNLNFPLHALCNKNEISQLLTSKFSWILIDHEDNQETDKEGWIVIPSEQQGLPNTCTSVYLYV